MVWSIAVNLSGKKSIETNMLPWLCSIFREHWFYPVNYFGDQTIWFRLWWTIKNIAHRFYFQQNPKTSRQKHNFENIDLFQSVLQGTVLMPLLFNIYLNDKRQNILPNCPNLQNSNNTMFYTINEVFNKACSDLLKKTHWYIRRFPEAKIGKKNPIKLNSLLFVRNPKMVLSQNRISQLKQTKSLYPQLWNT